MTTLRDSCAVGIDVVGTKTSAALVRFPSGEVLSRRRMDTRPDQGGDAVLSDLLSVSRDLISEAREGGREVSGIGVGIAELLDLEGNVTSDHTIKLKGSSLKGRLTELSPTRVDADVRMGALGEARWGAGKGLGSFVYVAVGTGIGSCFVQDGKPWAGSRGNALVMASSSHSIECLECDSPAPTLEEFASGHAILRRFIQSGGKAELAEDVFAAAEMGDDTVTGILKTSGEALGAKVAFLVNVLDPDAVVLGGGVSQVEGVYWEWFEQSLRAQVWAASTRALPVHSAGLGADSVMLGAAWSAGEERVP